MAVALALGALGAATSLVAGLAKTFIYKAKSHSEANTVQFNDGSQITNENNGSIRSNQVPVHLHVQKQSGLRDVLIISAMEEAQQCAEMIAKQLDVKVKVATDRKEGLEALRHSEYGVVVVEESLAENDEEWADQVWEQAGMAIPVQVNFAISGVARLGREVKAALSRRDCEQAVARKEAGIQIGNELKSTVTSMLLESELALREPEGSLSLPPKLRHLVEMAGVLRASLETQPARTVADYRTPNVTDAGIS